MGKCYKLANFVDALAFTDHFYHFISVFGTTVIRHKCSIIGEQVKVIIHNVEPEGYFNITVVCLNTLKYGFKR